MHKLLKLDNLGKYERLQKFCSGKKVSLSIIFTIYRFVNFFLDLKDLFFPILMLKILIIGIMTSSTNPAVDNKVGIKLKTLKAAK